MFRTVISVLIVLLCLTLIQGRSARFQLEIYNFTCLIMNDRMKRFDCYFRKLAESQFVMNQYVMFSQTIGEEFEGRLMLRVHRQGALKAFNFVDIKLKICDFLKNPLQSRLLMTAQNEMKKSSNVPLLCPLKGNFLYKFLNLSVTDEYIPSYAPFVNFTYSFEFYDSNILFGVSKVMGAIVKQ